MHRNSLRLISIPFFLLTIIFIPGKCHELNLKNNNPKNRTGKIKNISCSHEKKIIQDFERSFDHENRALIDRVNVQNNLIDFLGLGPDQYPENRMVKESKNMWNTFECHLSRFSEKYKRKTKDIFNGYNSSLSNLE